MPAARSRSVVRAFATVVLFTVLAGQHREQDDGREGANDGAAAGGGHVSKGSGAAAVASQTDTYIPPGGSARYHGVMRTIIVGGVAGGMSAATRLRRLDESAEIIVFERGHYVSFANCGLPYFVGGVIQYRQDLLLQTPGSLAARFRLDVRVDHEVTRIDPREKTVTVQNALTGRVTTEGYDHLILAAGATARPASTETDVPTHTLRTLSLIHISEPTRR